jgi:hypothetical protein
MSAIPSVFWAADGGETAGADALVTRFRRNSFRAGELRHRQQLPVDILPFPNPRLERNSPALYEAGAGEVTLEPMDEIPKLE